MSVEACLQETLQDFECLSRFHLCPAGLYGNSTLHCFRPTLPPAKQANRNLILKAISEAQDSITKTTAFPSSTFTDRNIMRPPSLAPSRLTYDSPTVPQRQTVPVAPRARLASTEEMSAAIQLVQEHLHSLEPRVRSYPPTDLRPSAAPGV